MLKINTLLFHLISVAIFSQNIATVQYKIDKSCYKFSIVRMLDIDDNNRFSTAKETYPKEGIFDVKTNDKFPLPYSFVCESEDHIIKASRLFTITSRSHLKFKIDSIVQDKQYLPVSKKKLLIQDQYQFYKFFPNTVKLYSENDDIYRANLIRYLPSFERYSKQYPNSYMLFWNLVNFFEENSYLTGFNDVYLRAFNNLSPTIRNSNYGKIFYQKMINFSKIKEGSRMPYIKLEGGKEYSLGSKYTLIDFWATYCKPCLEALPEYKKLYERYKNSGFEIVSISGDRLQDIDKWKKIVQDKQLNWQQYIDIRGKESEKYNITAYPSTFLLDSKGIIIKRDITPDELEKFLKENLK